MLAVRGALLELLRRTADLVAPRDCPCGAEGDWLCPDCGVGKAEFEMIEIG